MKQMAFFPVLAEDIRAILTGTAWTGVGHAATPEMRAGFGYSDNEDEEADWAALTIASVAGLAIPTRIILAAEVSVDVGADTEFGEVTATVTAADLRAAFRAEPAQGEGVRAAAEAVTGKRLAGAWDDPAVTALVADQDLLWHLPEEIAG